MGILKQVLPEAEFKMFAEKVMFVARRADHLYGGNFMDQLIEQCLVRLLKVNGEPTVEASRILLWQSSQAHYPNAF